jgi:hypothetical protein
MLMVGLFFRSQHLPPKPPRGRIIAQEGGITTWSTKSITVEFDGYRFKFPMNYGGVTNSGITLEGYWPGFTGIPHNEKQTPEERKARLYDYIVVFIDDYCVFKPPPSQEKLAEIKARNQAHFKRDYFDPVFDQELGLSVYRRRHNNEPTVYTMTNPDVKSQDGGIIGADCNTSPFVKGDENTIQCQSAFVFRPDLCVTIRFYKKHLRDWRAIHARVVDFIETSMNSAKEN